VQAITDTKPYGESMNFGLNDDQQMLRDTFARFLDSESSMARARAAQETNGFDRALWQGLAELGTFTMRVPEEAGGLGLGTLDATLVAEEAGRTLASGRWSRRWSRRGCWGSSAAVSFSKARSTAASW
jgi:alkylation response protein AidB-like acyl-CoA dehydrogenase